MTRYPYAARLNSFLTRPELAWPGRSERPTTLDLIDRAATVRGLSAVDVNFPQQAEGLETAAIRARIEERGLLLNGYAMRYGGDPAFRSGAFTNADPAVRQRAIDLTRRGIDEARAAGARMLTIWPGQDGVDHPFQVDYARLFDWEVEGFRQVAEHAPDFPVSIEYKPSEPRSIIDPAQRLGHPAGHRRGRRAEPGRHAGLRTCPGGRHEPGHGGCHGRPPQPGPGPAHQRRLRSP